MDFIYPKLNINTHKTIGEVLNTSDYPAFLKSQNNKQYQIPENVLVSIIRENVGYECSWSEAIIKDNRFLSEDFYNKKIYIFNDNLISLTPKKRYTPICNEDNNINPNATEVNVNLKEIFVPYIDQKNGLYSVRIQIDRDRIIDSVVFQNVLEEVYLEGVNVLLSSRGFTSDNDTINNLRNTYNTFAFINKDLDETINRDCEPLTFTVSIPLNFFNSSLKTKQNEDFGDVINSPPGPFDRTPNEDVAVTKSVFFTNKDLVTKIDTILQMFLSRASDIQRLTYPNSFIEGFILEFEIASLRKFVLAASELMQIAGVPIKGRSEDITEYEIGLSEDNEIVFIKATIDKAASNEYTQVTFNQSMLAQCRLRSDFNSKRIFNYFLKIENMKKDIINLSILEFLNKYVKYPEATLRKDEIIIEGKKIDPEKVKEFRINFSQQSENCVRFSEITNLSTAAVEFTDNFYTLFLQEDAKISLKTPLQQLRANIDSIEKEATNYSNPKNKAIKVQVSEGVEESLSVISQEFSFSLNTLSSVLSRLNIKQILFQQLLCNLKGLDPNDPETANIISQIPEQIITYFNYIVNTKNLTGKEFIKILQSGTSIDPKLFCSKNESVSYFVKGLKTLTQGINIANKFSQQYITFRNELANVTPIDNPYKELTKNLIVSAERLTVEFLIEYIKDVLTARCDDPLLANNYDNLADPFASHSPIENFNSAQNNNPQVIKDNRRDAVTYVYPEVIRELQFGPDVEYTINLIDSLLKDVNCILAPIESVQLLRGRPSDVVKVLVKNIIRNKYNKDPNNLSFLLQDDNKLQLFFERLGLTIDKNILRQIEITVTNVKEPATLCLPQVLEARKQLFENKLPKDLGILQDQLVKRKKEAQKILDRIKGGEIVFDYSVLCPDISNDQIDSVKDNIVSQYEDYIRSTFSGVLREFTDEVNKISNKYSEPQQLQRIDGKTIFDSLEYVNYNSTLYKNLASIPNLVSSFEYFEVSNRFINTKIKYLPLYQKEQDFESLLRSLVASSETLETALVCAEGAFTPSEAFLKFIDDRNILLNVSVLDDFFDDNGFDDPAVQGDLADIKDPKKDKDTALGNFLNSKQYFIAIQVNQEIPGDDSIQIRFVFNDTFNNKFRILESFDFPASNENDRISDVFVYFPTNNAKEQIFLKKESNFIDTTITVITKDWIESKDVSDEIKNILQAAFDKFTKEYKDKIENYNNVASTINAFRDLSIFDIRRIIGAEKNKIETSVFVTTQKYDNSTKSSLPSEAEYYKTETVYEEKDFVKHMIKSLDVSYHITENGFPNFNSTPQVGTISGVPERKDVYYNISSYIYNRLITRIGAQDNQSINPEFPDARVDKRQLFLKDFYISDEWACDKDASFEDNLKNKNAKFTKNSKYKDPWLTNFSTLSRFDYVQDIKYINCNIYPHYLNLDYYIDLAIKEAKTRLCDTNLPEVPKEILDEIIVNLTTRTYVTDLLIKSIPFLTLLDITDLNSLENEKIIIDVLRENIKNEMRVFSPQVTPPNPDLYFNYFIEKVKKVYNRYLEAQKLKNKFISTGNDLNKEINYFIRKEIRHFIKYSLQKDIFVANKNKSFYKELIKRYNFTTETRSSYDQIMVDGYGAQYNKEFIDKYGIYKLENLTANDITFDSYTEVYEIFDPRGEKNFTDSLKILKNKYTDAMIKDEFYNIISYFIMANTVDFNKRIILHSTKKELADIFGKTLPLTDEVENSTRTEFIDNDRSQEDVVKFLSNLSTSPNPAAMIFLKPQYSKYIAKFLDVAASTARSSLLTIAQSQDINILITRKFQLALSTISSLSWSLIDQQTRNSLILGAKNDTEALFYKRLEDGKSPAPDIVVSALPLGSGIPGTLGLAYLALDTYEEVKWVQKAIEELKNLRGNTTPAEDPCAVPPEEVKNNINDDLACTPDRQEQLRTKINSFEEP